MCIAIYKPAGEKLPSKKTLRLCNENNPDYCGYMIATGTEVLIRKGFGDVKKMLKSLRATQTYYGIVAKDCAVVLHFRIATSGLVKPQNALPFPISSKVAELQDLKLSCETGMAHNGIFWKIKAKDNLSDTQLMVRDELSKYSFDEMCELQPTLDALFDCNKVVVLNKDSKVLRFGSWIECGGSFFSNSTYLSSYGHKYGRVGTGKIQKEFQGLIDYDPTERTYDGVRYLVCLGCGRWFDEDDLVNGYCTPCFNSLCSGNCETCQNRICEERP